MPRLEPRLDNSDDVSSQAARGRGNSGLPTANVYIPNYHGVNQLLTRAGGDGAIAFGDALAAHSMRDMEAHQAVYDNLESTSAMVLVNEKINRDSREFKESNPSGKGYQQYITEQYKKYTDEAMANASNPTVSQNLQMFTMKGMVDWANKSFKEEATLRTSYAFRETDKNNQILLNNIHINPDNFGSLFEQYKASVNTMSGILPKGQFETYQADAYHNAIYAYGLGLIEKDPHQAKELLKGDVFVNGLPADKFSNLSRHADVAIRSEESNRRLVAAIADRNEKAHQDVNTAKLDGLIEAGAASHKTIDEFDISDTQRERAYNKLAKYERQQEEKQKDQVEISTRVSEGTPLTGISEQAQVEYYRNAVRQMRQSNPDNPPTIMDKAMVATNMKATAQIDDLVADIQQIMSNGTASEAVQAAFALNYLRDTNVITIGKIGSEYKYFADEVERNAIFEGSEAKNAQVVVDNARGLYFSPVTEQTIKDHKAAYSQYTENGKLKGVINEIVDDFTTEGFIRKTIHPSMERSIRSDAERLLQEAFMAGARGDDAKRSVMNSLKRTYTSTDINGSPQYMKFAPEAMYPQYRDTHFIKNNYAESVQSLVDAASKNSSVYTGTPVRLKNPLIRQYADPNRKFQTDLTTGNVPVIEADIDGKWEAREVYIEPAPHQIGTYNAYFLYENGKFMTKRYLKKVYKNAQGHVVTSPQNARIAF